MRFQDYRYYKQNDISLNKSEIESLIDSFYLEKAGEQVFDVLYDFYMSEHKKFNTRLEKKFFELCDYFLGGGNKYRYKINIILLRSYFDNAKYIECFRVYYQTYNNEWLSISEKADIRRVIVSILILLGQDAEALFYALQIVNLLGFESICKSDRVYYLMQVALLYCKSSEFVLAQSYFSLAQKILGDEDLVTDKLVENRLSYIRIYYSLNKSHFEGDTENIKSSLNDYFEFMMDNEFVGNDIYGNIEILELMLEYNMEEECLKVIKRILVIDGTNLDLNINLYRILSTIYENKNDVLYKRYNDLYFDELLRDYSNFKENEVEYVYNKIKLSDITALINEMNEAYELDFLSKCYTRDCFNSDKENFTEGYILFFDLNDLKKTNDHSGHDYGDELIRKFGSKLVKGFPNDKAYRIGGDEFLVISTDMLFDSIAKKMDKLLDNCKLDEIEFCCGIAHFEKDNFDEKLKLADEAMYQVKRTNSFGYKFNE